MIFAETDRLFLRTLEKQELPRLVELIGVWDVTRWLSVVPFPYRLQDAQDFYSDMESCYEKGEPEFFTLALKSDNLLIGGIGLHLPRNAVFEEGEIEIGYWLGKTFWGRGLIPEAAMAVLDIGFARPSTQAIGASTAPSNRASQSVLRKIGLKEKGLVPCDYPVLRGENEIIKWRLTRPEYEETKSR